MKISLPSKSALSQCKAYFTNIPDHIFATLWLVCSAIILARSTNLSLLKDYLPQLLANDQTKPCSHYKRLIRFFRQTNSEGLVRCILQFVFRLFQGRFHYLVMDATTWQVGKKSIHLLTLCILFRNTAIPIYWLQLAKKGHSSEVERERLITEALRYYKLKAGPPVR